MHMEPEDFVDWIVTKLHVKSLVVGTDFHFGYQRRGDHKLLQKLALSYGYQVEVVEKVQEDGCDISSTRIRDTITKGQIRKANSLLG